MSVKLQQRPRTVRRPAVHDPRPAGAPPAAGPADERPTRRPAQTRAPDIRTGLIGLGIVLVVLLAFTAMVLLTAAAGGDTFLS